MSSSKQIFIFFLLLTATMSIAHLALSQDYGQAATEAIKFYQAGNIPKAIESGNKAVAIAKKQFGEKDINYAQALSLTALFYQTNKEYSKAEPLYKLSLALYRELGQQSSKDYFNVLTNYGVFYLMRGLYKEAEPVYLELTNILSAKKDDKALSGFLIDLGFIYYNLQKNSEGEKTYLKALPLYKLHYGEDPKLADGNGFLGLIFLNQGKSDQAETYLVSSLDIYKRIKQESAIGYFSLTNSLAAIYIKQKKFLRAAVRYNDLLTAVQNTKGINHPNYSIILNNLGELYTQFSQYAQAEEKLLKAADIQKKLLANGVDTILAKSLFSLGNLYYQTGEFNKAEKFFLEAKAIYKSKGELHSANYIILSGNLALLYVDMGKYIDAENTLKSTLSETEKTIGKSSLMYAECLNKLGSLYIRLGRYNEAEPLFTQSMDIHKKLPGAKFDDYASVVSNLAYLYEKTKRNDKAGPLYLEALTMCKSHYGEYHPEYATMLSNLAVFYINTNELAKAEPMLQQVLAIRKRLYGVNNIDYAGSLYNLAAYYFEMGMYVKAIPLLEESVKIVKVKLGESHPEYNNYICNLGVAYASQNRMAEAQGLFKKMNQNNLKMVENLFPFMSDKEREEYYQTLRSYFHKFNSFAIERAKDDPAILNDLYNNQLATKGLLLNAQKKIMNHIHNSNNAALIANYNKWRQNKELLAKYYMQTKEELAAQHISTDSLEAVTNNIEKELSKQSDKFSQQSSLKKITWKEIRAQLKPGEAAAEIIRINANQLPGQPANVYYAILVITPNTLEYPKMVLLKNGKELEEKYLKHYLNCIKFKIEDNDSYNLYFKEIANSIKESAGKNASKIYFSLDGVYNQINIGTLFNTQSQKYVFDEMDIQIVSNSKDIVPVNKTALAAGQSITAELFGFPTYSLKNNTTGTFTETTREAGTFSLAELPGTKIEIESSQKILLENKWKTNSHLGAEATENSIKSLSNPYVLHIATHGFFMKDIEEKKKLEKSGGDPSENPLLRSGLMLAGAADVFKNNSSSDAFNPALLKVKEEDGILTAYEAMNLSLDHTELVILSACETAVGEVKNGEGVYGLQRAFKIAGAKTLIMSLWKVDDLATQELMITFYSNWTKTNNKVLAFKEAQKSLKAKYPHPYYWGAFVMIGE
jgi:CHAT domain-containing protein